MAAPTQHPSSILVLGLGELGRAVLQELARHPARQDMQIAVLKRTSGLDNDLQAFGIEVVVGDVVEDSEEQLASVFKPFHTVISCNGMTLPPETQVKVARVAIKSGITRYFPWQFGVDYDVIGPNSSQNLFTTQLEVRALLREQSALRWVIISTGMFTSFLFEPGFGLVNEDRTKVTAIGSWDNAITVTSPEDIGRITAEIALSYPELHGVVYTAGDTVSMERLAGVVEKQTGKQVERVLKTVADLKEDLATDPDNGMLKYRVVFGEGAGVAWDRQSTFNAMRGIETETVDEWAAQHL